MLFDLAPVANTAKPLDPSARIAAKPDRCSADVTNASIPIVAFQACRAGSRSLVSQRCCARIRRSKRIAYFIKIEAIRVKSRPMGEPRSMSTIWIGTGRVSNPYPRRWHLSPR